MKYTLALLLTLFAGQGFAQVKEYSNMFFFLYRMDLKDHAGKNFRYGAEIKSVPDDPDGHAGIQTMQIGENDYDFVESDKKISEPADTAWHRITIEGKIQGRTKQMWLYVVQEGNGRFCVDGMRLEVQNADGSWTDLPVKNGDFEQPAPEALKGFITHKRPPATLLTATAGVRGGQALCIKGTGATVTWRIHYGNNAPTGKYCTVNGARLYYETYGTGEPLLLLHGNGQSIWAFHQQIPELAKTYRVIAVDTRAQGRSTNTAPKLDYDLFAADMKTLLDSLHLKNVNVLGWSDGGNTALIMAIKYPEYVNKIMVMGANLHAGTDAIKKSMLDRTASAIKQLEKSADPKNQNTLLLLKMLLTEPNIAPADLQKITAKALIMAGENDLVVDTHTRLIAANIKNAQLAIFKGEGHDAPDHNPTLFNKTVLDFLAK